MKNGLYDDADQVPDFRYILYRKTESRRNAVDLYSERFWFEY
jgi:hypothetical protein